MENRLKELRNERGFKQDEVAGRVNVSQQTMSRIENGECALTADVLVALSKVYRVSSDYILKISDEKYIYESGIEIRKQMEKHADFCEQFDRLNIKNRKLIFMLMEQLEKGQTI